MSLDPARAAVRSAVRRGLPVLHDGRGGHWVPDVADGGAILVACSGGADSLALLAATVFELRRAPVRVIGVVVDHGLQDRSAEHTARVVGQMAEIGADETASIRVRVDAGGLGPEAGAREARYAALVQMAQHFDSRLVLLGHTLDDQAETVLLGLTRGSGGRSLAGMRPGFYRGEPGPGAPFFRRPLLDVRRAQTEAACAAEGIDFWADPHNADPRFTRSRVRHTVLPTLERELGPGVTETLARTAEQLRPDMEALDIWAEDLLAEVDTGDGLDCHLLETRPFAVQTRVLRRAALAAGCPPSELAHGHVVALASVVLGADGAAPRLIRLPGHLTGYREGRLLRFEPTADRPAR